MIALPRRRFLAQSLSLCAAVGIGSASVAFAAQPEGANRRRILVLIELKGGNDGLNTLVPFADDAYYALRPRIAIARDNVVRLSDQAGLHPSLAPLLPLWQANRLAVLQSVGYPAPNLSHFRSIEIWDTASASDETLADGWLARAFANGRERAGSAADGVIIGSNEIGPLAGRESRAIALADTGSFRRRARLAQMPAERGNRALAHIGKVEADIVAAAAKLIDDHAFTTSFPSGPFGAAVRTACQVIASPIGAAVVRLTLDGFDTHANQPATHARLLGELANAIVALEAALTEIGRFDDALVLTYAEFGRRPRENLNAGTDHGTASVHFALGGRVRGGFFGNAADLARLDGGGNVAHALDFRAVYATVLERWWGIDSRAALRGRFTPVNFIDA
ncbi:MAG TPA: DUF1501 domain-containing protein [Casimicrobiaceae bacterium]|nr:DUF1501 domain-containing protein [Casimicrobiaceae bacterium]